MDHTLLGCFVTAICYACSEQDPPYHSPGCRLLCDACVGRSDHTLPVTCLHLGMGEGSAVLVTASLDHSIKLWSLATGQLLRSLTLPAGVTSVTMDAGEHILLAGCADGSIYEVSLVGTQQQQQLLQGVTRAPAAAAAAGAAGSSSAGAGVVGGPGSCCYEGHTKAVSCLVVTPDGEQLVSGCEDGTARVWDLRSRQCLRVIQAPNKAPVSGVLLVGSPARLAGFAAGSSSSSSSKAGPKRLQPLAQLAKFAGAASAAKPWEGPLQVLDAAGCGGDAGPAAAAAAAGVTLLPPGLVLQPCQDPLALLGQEAVSQAEVDQVAVAPAAASDDAGEVARLQEQVAQLQQQLQESQRVAEQWQSLHGHLHQFCTEQVLASP